MEVSTIGFLAAKDLGSLGVTTNNNIFEGFNASPDGIFNPTGSTYPNNFGVVNLKAFSFSYTTGKVTDDTENIAGNTTRVGVGSTRAVPFVMNARFNRKPVNLAATEITSQNTDSITFLTQWSRTRNIVMLFWLPNTASTSWLNHKQDKDFFTSQIKTIYDVLWDRSQSSSTKGFQATTYGTFHYKITDMFGSGQHYEPCAIPVVFESVQVKEDAQNYWIDVEVNGFCLEDEQRYKT